jgi:hypothetical protein
MLTVPLAVVRDPETGLAAPIAIDPLPAAVDDVPTVVELTPLAVAASPTAVALLPLATELTPHSVLFVPAPALHSGVASAQAGVVVANMTLLVATSRMVRTLIIDIGISPPIMLPPRNESGRPTIGGWRPVVLWHAGDEMPMFGRLFALTHHARR